MDLQLERVNVYFNEANGKRFEFIRVYCSVIKVIIKIYSKVDCQLDSIIDICPYTFAHLNVGWPAIKGVMF